MNVRITRLPRPAGLVASLPRALLLAMLVGGCTAPQSTADLQRQQACGQQADRQFEKQNRYLMSEQDQSSSPFSSNGTIGITSQGLDDQYHRDNMVDDCLHSAPGTEPTMLPAATSR